MSTQQAMQWADAPAGTEQPWVITFKDGTTQRVSATSRWDAISKVARGKTKLVASCEPATLSLFERAARRPRDRDGGGT